MGVQTPVQSPGVNINFVLLFFFYLRTIELYDILIRKHIKILKNNRNLPQNNIIVLLFFPTKKSLLKSIE